MNGKRRVVCFMLGAAACLAAGCSDDPATPTPPVNVAPAPTEDGAKVPPPKAEANAPAGGRLRRPGGAGSGEAGSGSAAAGRGAPTPQAGGTVPQAGAERPGEAGYGCEAAGGAEGAERARAAAGDAADPAKPGERSRKAARR